MLIVYALMFLVLGVVSGILCTLLVAERMAQTAARFMATLTLVFFALATIAAFQAAMAHDKYEHWTSPDNPTMSCCHGTDCRPTRAYLHEDGLWRAWDGGQWLIVPKGKMLPIRLRRGRAVAPLRARVFRTVLQPDEPEGVGRPSHLSAIGFPISLEGGAEFAYLLRRDCQIRRVDHVGRRHELVAEEGNIGERLRGRLKSLYLSPLGGKEG